jgi:hypothetical protein
MCKAVPLNEAFVRAMGLTEYGMSVLWRANAG